MNQNRAVRGAARWGAPMSSFKTFLAVSIGSILFGANLAAGQALEPQLEGAELIEALQAGGLVILMRHMSTDSVVPDESTFSQTDCSTQRNLDADGLEQATAVGAAIKSLEIPIGDVLTSPYCRCVDTGDLVFGKATPQDQLAVFDVLTGDAKAERAKSIRGMLNTPPQGPGNTVLITHAGALLYTFGLQTRPEGIVHVFRPAAYGPPGYLGRIAPEQWIAMAAASDSE